MEATTLAHANPFAIKALVLDSIQAAAGHAEEYVTRLEALVAEHGSGGLDDVANAATKDARIGAFRVNKEAQERLTPLFDDTSLGDKVRSILKQADASLEDSGWQIQNKDSPDGRFVGIDLGGALDDATDAARSLRKLAPAAPVDSVPLPPPTVAPTAAAPAAAAPASIRPVPSFGGGSTSPPVDEIDVLAPQLR